MFKAFSIDVSLGIQMCVKTKQPKAQAWLTNLNELILGIELGSLNLKLILSLASEPS